MRALRGLWTLVAVTAAISAGPSCSCGDDFGSSFGGGDATSATGSTASTAQGPSTGASTSSTASSSDGGGPDTGGQGPGSGGQGPGSGGQGPGSGGQGPGSGGQGPGSGGAAQGGGGSAPTECDDAADCDTQFGAPACGVWACNGGLCDASSAGCTDADHDGYGAGVACACAGLDCDDADDTIGSDQVRSCYSGPAGSDTLGTCSAGTETCTAGAWSPCVGEILPSGEACNGQDDDCDGNDDDGLGTILCGLGACQTGIPACLGGTVATCTPTTLAVPDVCNGIDDDCDGPIDEDCITCVPVAPAAAGGSDAVVTPTFAAPFATVQHAIDWTVLNNGPTVVCVAAGASCGTSATYTNAANTTITMADGISVLGNYARTAGTWTHCSPTSGTTTILQPQTAEGVTFPATVTSPTSLDGFRVDRYAGATTTSGITVDGATNVILAHVQVTNTPSVDNSYGLRVINGGSALVTQSKLDAGDGGTNNGESIGIQAIGSQVTVTNNCLSLDGQGRCDDGCGSNPSIRGNTVVGGGTSYAIELDDSPGSIVESSALCNAQATVSAMIHVIGDATGTVIRANNIAQFGGVNESYGVWMEDCADAAPWVVDNFRIIAGGQTNATIVDAVRAMGACHPVVDSNVRITGGGEGNASATTGVHCGANGSVASQCVVLNNRLIEGSQFGFPPGATGVQCDDDGCARIAGNLITGRGGAFSRGVALQFTTAVVEDNVIRGGCSATTTGIDANDTAARIQNNLVSGYSSVDCVSGPAALATSNGMAIRVASGVFEIDVHSNTIDGTGSPNACTSRGIAFDAGSPAPSAGVGIFRNNILLAGSCITARQGFAELSGADPRVFENNDLDPTGAPTALYLDEAATSLTTDVAVNALLDMTVSGVFSAAAGFVSYPADLHLAAGSPCEGAGTSAGAPPRDFEGDVRDAVAPDVGADER